MLGLCQATACLVVFFVQLSLLVLFADLSLKFVLGNGGNKSGSAIVVDDGLNGSSPLYTASCDNLERTSLARHNSPIKLATSPTVPPHNADPFPFSSLAFSHPSSSFPLFSYSVCNRGPLTHLNSKHNLILLHYQRIFKQIN